MSLTWNDTWLTPVRTRQREQSANIYGSLTRHLLWKPSLPVRAMFVQPPAGSFVEVLSWQVIFIFQTDSGIDPKELLQLALCEFNFCYQIESLGCSSFQSWPHHLRQLMNFKVTVCPLSTPRRTHGEENSDKVSCRCDVVWHPVEKQNWNVVCRHLTNEFVQMISNPSHIDC